jgi:hypothetical protein
VVFCAAPRAAQAKAMNEARHLARVARFSVICFLQQEQNLIA